MQLSKKNVVSIILFSLSAVMFIIFAFTIFFEGQMIGGAIYFIYFAIYVAFAFLDRRYHSNFINLYRYSVYVADLFNILAAASILFYGIHSSFMIAVVSIWGSALLVDIISKNRLETRRVGSILVSLFNMVTMIAIFPYFFMDNLTVGYAIGALVTSSLVLILKIMLALVPAPKKNKEETSIVSENAEVVIPMGEEHNVE